MQAAQIYIAVLCSTVTHIGYHGRRIAGYVLFEVLLVQEERYAVYAVAGKQRRHSVDLRLELTVRKAAALGKMAYVLTVLLHKTTCFDDGGCPVHPSSGLAATALIGRGLGPAVYHRFKKVEHALCYRMQPGRPGTGLLILPDGIGKRLLKFCGKHGYGLAPCPVEFRRAFHNMMIG